MAVSHVESFIYNNWSISRSGVYVSSSGTGSKFSGLYPINKVIGNITASATGGYGWCSAYGSDRNEHGDSLYCNLTVTIYLVSRGGQRAGVASATGSAYRDGYLNCYAGATTGSLTFNTANITDQQKALYESIQIGYACSTSKSSAQVEQVGDFRNGGTGNPYGTASITIRDTINVDFDGIDLTNLYFDGSEMSGLNYDGTIIF